MTTTTSISRETRLLSKVPEVTLFFWIIKILCTTVGETAADFLNVNLNFGLTNTSLVTGVLLVVALGFQLQTGRYVPVVYWTVVAVISVFGTLVTDNLTDSLGVPLEASTVAFSVLLALTFGVWFASERTLSIHSIVSRRRETMYWLAVLFTFALGTAAGDLLAEGLGLGYLVTGLIVAGLIALTALAWRLGLDPVLSFWVIYILTRPLGASLGDLLSQPRNHNGLGLGATTTSAIFVAGIVATVWYLSLTKADVIADGPVERAEEGGTRGGLWQTAVVVCLLLVVGGAGYHLRKNTLEGDVVVARPVNGNNAGSSQSPLGDLSTLRAITQDTLNRLDSGDQPGATKRVDDLEYEWDQAEARLKPRSKATWTTVDDRIDTVLRQLRAVHPDTGTEKSALSALLGVLR